MEYIKQFDPSAVQSFRTDYAQALRERTDRRDGEVYVYADDERIVLTVNVALATGRPLLVFGPAGSGKSSLAANIARTMRWRYYEAIITSRTQAQDLLWTFDVVRRLADATARQAPSGTGSGESGSSGELHRYLEPSVLWWAFDPKSAAKRGLDTAPGDFLIADPSLGPPASPAVVLLDEIDKADPDVPNNLLVPIGSLSFTVKETGTRVTAARIPLVVITTNEERDLPPAFLRRCVVLRLRMPNESQLIDIAAAHYGPDHAALYGDLARRTIALGDEYVQRGLRPPSTAEFLDAVRACVELQIDPTSSHWNALLRAVVAKPDVIDKESGDEVSSFSR
jgi:MoxR-like ATPase